MKARKEGTGLNQSEHESLQKILRYASDLELKALNKITSALIDPKQTWRKNEL